MGTGPADDALDRRLQELDARLSPLPTESEMESRAVELDARDFDGSHGSQVPAQHWADCLRWVAEHWGGKSTDLFSLHGHRTLKELADELEARRSHS